MADKLRLGVVGANPNVGWASRTHMPALAGLPEYELAAVCTTKEESAKAAAQKYEADRAYWDFRELVKDPAVDVVDVCVKVPYHHEIVMAALEAGKHVYCEWPLAANVAQAEEMANLAEKRGLHTMVGLQARAAPSIIHLRNLVQQGWLGRVMSANMTQFSGGLLEERTPDGIWRADYANGANPLTIAFGHAIDAFTWCLGPLTEISGVVTTLAPEWAMKGGGTTKVSAPDFVSLTGRLADGGVAVATVGSVPHHPSAFRLEVYGSEGTIVATASGNVQAQGVRLMGARAGEKELAELEVPSDLRWVPAEVPGGTPFNFAQMARRFAEGIQSGKPAGPTFADAVRNHRLLAALERASSTGQTVKIQA